jgi:TLD
MDRGIPPPQDIGTTVAPEMIMKSYPVSSVKGNRNGTGIAGVTVTHNASERSIGSCSLHTADTTGNHAVAGIPASVSSKRKETERDNGSAPTMIRAVTGSGFCFDASAIQCGDGSGFDDDSGDHIVPNETMNRMAEFDSAANRNVQAINQDSVTTKSNSSEMAATTVSSSFEFGSQSGMSLWQTLTSTYSMQRSCSAERDAVVASTALMGENILDSPVQTTTKSIRNDTNNTTTTRLHEPQWNHKTPLAPNLRVTARTMDHAPATTIPQSSSANPDSNRAKFSATSAAAANAVSVGIMAQGLAWARRQRDRRQRQYLQHQAEQQLFKIRQAQGVAAANNETSGSTLLEHNPTFQSLHAGAVNQSQQCTQTANDSNSTIDHGHAVSSLDSNCVVSTSGDGYSVALPVDLTSTVANTTTSNNNDDMAGREDEDAAWIPTVRVEPEADIEPCPLLLSPDERQQIAQHVLPRSIADCRWKRLYSLARDGDSFDACLRNVAMEKPTLLVVRTSRSALFGGFADEPWAGDGSSGHGGGGGASYCGGPSACLFRIIPNEDTSTVQDACGKAPMTSASDDHDEHQVRTKELSSDEQSSGRDGNNEDGRKTTVKCYRWTGANRYIQLCDVKHKMLAFGGGGTDGSFGLCVTHDFQVGSTGPCATFNNEPLCGPDEHCENFAIVDLEIYGFLLGQF